MGTSNRSRTSPRRAFTLMEMLIVMFIIGVISGTFIQMIVCSKRTLQAVAHRSGSGLDLMVAAWRISTDVRGSSRKYLCDGSGGGLQAFSFISAQDDAGRYSLKADGTPDWRKQVTYYIDSSTCRLMRKETRLDLEADPTLLRAYTLDELKKAMDGTGRVVASSVTSLRLVPSVGGESAATLFIQTESQNANGRRDRQSREFAIFIYD